MFGKKETLAFSLFVRVWQNLGKRAAAGDSVPACGSLRDSMRCDKQTVQVSGYLIVIIRGIDRFRR